MASLCPKCHQEIENDSVCCAEVKYTWKCRSCGRLSTGFVVPYGRCFLCGGENELVRGYSGEHPELVAIVSEAVRYEVDMYHFYRMALARATDPVLRAVFEELYHKEEDHLAELEEKYHLHFSPELRNLPGPEEKLAAGWIFENIDFNSGSAVAELYDKAIVMERRTRDRFLERAAALPPGTQREIYRELAAEESDHVSILETEREQFLTK